MSEEQRSAIVTGASSGIGAATAVEFGRRGWSVAIGARRTDRLAEVAKQVEAAGGKAFAHALDVTDVASIDAFVRAAEAALPPCDLLVNNAGGSRSARIHEATPAELENEIRINLLGPIWMTNRILPGMRERLAGDVVFVGSDSAANPRTFQGAYGAAKSGLETFAKVVELETEGMGIRSILVRVGPTGSEFGNQMPKDRIKEILESWQYLGVYRRHHWMPAESVAKAIARTVAVPLEESITTIIDVMPGGRAKEYRP
jgi:NADP-dependent 3-hydroxy acid dehydrogenase YdfG